MIRPTRPSKKVTINTRHARTNTNQGLGLTGKTVDMFPSTGPVSVKHGMQSNISNINRDLKMNFL